MAVNPIPLMVGQGVTPRLDPLEAATKVQSFQDAKAAFEERRAARQQKEQANAIFKEAGGDWRKAQGLATERGMMDYAGHFGELADKHDTAIATAQKSLADMDENRRKAAMGQIQEFGKLSRMVLEQPEPMRAKAFDFAARRMGREDLIGQYNEDEAQMVVRLADAFGAEQAEAKPMTDLGKLNWELKRGMITQDQYNAAIRKATTHAPGTNVNLNMGQEKEEGKTVGKGFGETYMKLQDAGLAANNKLNRYTRMESLLSGVETGRLTPTTTQVAALADSLGFRVDPNLDSKQAFDALSKEIALELRNPSGGAGMPGAMSDKDREFLVSMTPSLAKTPQGNRLIIETAKKLAKRDQEVATLARQYRQRNGSLDEGFYDDLAAFSEANPLFGKTPSAPAPAQRVSIVGPNGQRLYLSADGKSWEP